MADAELVLDLRRLGTLSCLNNMVSLSGAVKMSQGHSKNKDDNKNSIPAPGGPIKMMRICSETDLGFSDPWVKRYSRFSIRDSSLSMTFFRPATVSSVMGAIVLWENGRTTREKLHEGQGNGEGRSFSDRGEEFGRKWGEGRGPGGWNQNRWRRPKRREK